MMMTTAKNNNNNDNDDDDDDDDDKGQATTAATTTTIGEVWQLPVTAAGAARGEKQFPATTVHSCHTSHLSQEANIICDCRDKEIDLFK